MGGTSLPAGCQMFTSASVQTEGLGSGFLSADAVLRAVLRVSGAHFSREKQRTPSLSTPAHTSGGCSEPGHLTKSPLHAGWRASKCGLWRLAGQTHGPYPEIPGHPIFPAGAWHGRPDSRNGHHLDKQLAGLTRGQGVANPSHSSFFQPLLPAPPSSQFSPHPQKNRGLEIQLRPVAIIARSPPPASGGCQGSGHLSRRLGYQVSRVMLLWQLSQ